MKSAKSCVADISQVTAVLLKHCSIIYLYYVGISNNYMLIVRGTFRESTKRESCVEMVEHNEIVFLLYPH